MAAILVQSELERERFLALGVAPERCMLAGNLKYLHDQESATESAEFAHRVGCSATDRVIAVGSIHSDEARHVVEALGPLVSAGVRLIVAPRRPDAVDAVAAESRRRGWTTWLRSAGAPPAAWRVLILDTFGELRLAYALAGVAVVGGGFGRNGGHNPCEPLLAGTPVLIGPHFDHFASEAASLRAAAPECVVIDRDHLAKRASELVADDARRRSLLQRQRTALPDPRRIADRYLEVLVPMLHAAGVTSGRARASVT
jgi:3-deoxy-D-manno-octulosonic-acid transferase